MLLTTEERIGLKKLVDRASRDRVKRFARIEDSLQRDSFKEQNYAEEVFVPVEAANCKMTNLDVQFLHAFLYDGIPMKKVTLAAMRQYGYATEQSAYMSLYYHFKRLGLPLEREIKAGNPFGVGGVDLHTNYL